MKPYDMGVLFDECAERATTTVHLDRPFDIAPRDGTAYRVPDLARLVQAAAGWLAAAGARRGDQVAVVKPNHWDYDLLACAAIRIGAVPVKLSARLSPSALGTLLKRLDVAVLVTTSEILRSGEEAGVDLASLATVTLSLDESVLGALTLDDVRGQDAPRPVRPRDGDPLIVMHTSGTTGLPKLVVHSTGTIIGKLARLEANRIPVLGVRRDDTVANASAFAHGRTFCWTASAMCLAPRGIVIVTGQEPDSADPVLRAHPPTIIEALPATFVRFQPLTTRLDTAFRDTRLFVSTYDAMHPPTVRAYLTASSRKRPIWMQGWGQSETGPLSFGFHTRRSVTGAQQSTLRDLGRPIPLRTRLRVVDPDTLLPVPRGRPGLVLARTPGRCLGYVGEEERFQDKQIGPWWNTGDLAVLSRDGRVRLLDREVDRTPELSCLETEDVLETRLRCLECVVLGVPGADPLPVVVTADGTLDRTAWERAIRGLPAMQEPTVLTWDQLPRTGTGKVRRQELLAALTGSADTHGSGRWT